MYQNVQSHSAQSNKEQLVMAHSALQDGDFAAAEELYRHVLQSEPHNVVALDALGVLQCQLGQPFLGIEFFQDSLALDMPSELRATILLHLAFAFRQNEQESDFLPTLRESVRINALSNSHGNSHGNSHDDLAINSHFTGDSVNSAVTKSANSINPDLQVALGQACFDAGLLTEALICFRMLSDCQPENASAWLTIGYIHEQQENYDDAIVALKNAENCDSASPDVCFHLAESLRKGEYYEESIPYYQRLLSVGTEWTHAVHGYGKSLLALGYFEDGWDAMEFRLACTFGTWGQHFLPNWQSDHIAAAQNGDESAKTPPSKTVLAYAEEGVSAEIMFGSCLPDLINEVEQCVIECDSSLHGIFRRSFPRATIVPLTHTEVGGDSAILQEERIWKNDQKQVKNEIAGGKKGESTYMSKREERFSVAPQKQNEWNLSIDSQVAMGSLPRYFRRCHEDFPLRKAFLVPNKERVSYWSNRLMEQGEGSKIGVLWQGMWTAESEKQRTLPSDELQNLLMKHASHASWICLQHGGRQKEIESFRRNAHVHMRLYSEIFQYDLDEMAALLCSLDLVITPPGYVAHLAGGLGVQTWLVLPSEADWRWNLGRMARSTESVQIMDEPCLWYPTFRMFRQHRNQAWSEIFEHLDNKLNEFLKRDNPIAEQDVTTLAFPKQKNFWRKEAA
ncbi:MAG: tetratricopeptide repeat protein [Thermoguttaceae bacterium]